MSLFSRRLGLLGAGVVGVGAIAALTVGASFSLFTAQAGPARTVFTAGTVSLNSPASVSCPVQNLEPGDSGTCDFTVNYGGSLPAYIGAIATPSGTLAQQMTFDINGTSQASPTPVLIGDWTTVSGSHTFTATVAYTLALSAPNAYQHTSATLSVEFYATQCSNNGLNPDGSVSTSSNEDCTLPPASWSEALNVTAGTNRYAPTASPGSSWSFTVNLWQFGTESSNATYNLMWPAGDLTFVSSGGDATCSATASSATCSVTDAGHSLKSEPFNFTVGAGASGTVTVNVGVVTGSGAATTQASFTAS